MIKRLWSGFWLAVLLVGVPVVLVVMVGNPLPARRDLAALVAEPLAEDNVYAAIALVAWLIWAGLLYAALAEAWVRARRAARWLRRLPRLPLPTAIQGLTGGMLGAIAVTTSTTATDAAPPAAASTLDDTAPTSSRMAREAVGVELPDGGWLPISVADAVNAAAAAVWWRRRRLYHPDTDDAGVTPLPATVAAVQATLADAAPATSPVAAVFELPARGVGLTGPGAAAAARGALVSLLLTHRSGHPRVVTTNDDLEVLIGGADTVQTRIPGLHVADGLAEACAAMDAMAVDHPGRPVTILTAIPDDPGLVRRLAALLTLGAAHNLTGLILGPWPHGTTWHIDTDGSIDTRPGRLATLTSTATNDLLTLAALQIREDPAAPAPPPPSPSRQAAARGR
ncbi:hypothetical protein [Phytohabitans houttuyneae]|uniref:Uncharacterized protein n=1 Tax=Phytohabitans houttuyneae TaxID=1076126 RepID=A0A6V8KRJ9_9ACTN|nr:hypothetical protein [Phytohabitans houttuyneae]GFJ84981.1 hypothetical protein Phou_091610 [Phytohabitans houttuyneae]